MLSVGGTRREAQEDAALASRPTQQHGAQYTRWRKVKRSTQSAEVPGEDLGFERRSAVPVRAFLPRAGSISAPHALYI